jgi:hypothetical protein
MFIAVTKNGSCHVVEVGNEGAVKVAVNLRKMPHEMDLSAPQSVRIVNSTSTPHNEIRAILGACVNHPALPYGRRAVLPARFQPAKACLRAGERRPILLI